MTNSPISARAALAALTAASAATSLALWVGVIAAQWDRLMALGSLCSHGGLLAHCAACYPAAALTVLAVGGALGLVLHGRAMRLAAA